MAMAMSVSLALAACSRGDAPSAPPSPPAPSPMSASSLARVLHVDAASVLESPIDPPAPTGDLRGDIESFTTVDACVAQRAAVDPLVGDALHAIGYDTFLRDACRTLAAAKAKDPRECEAIDSQPLRGRCRTIVAVLQGDADACPLYVSVRPAMGRDPTCLAMASKDPRLCAAADPSDRPECEALAMRDPKPCDAILRDAERARCGRELARLATILPDPGEARSSFAAPRGTLTIHPRSPGARAILAAAAAVDAGDPAVALALLDGDADAPDAASVVAADGGAGAATEAADLDAAAPSDVTVDISMEIARGLVIVQQGDGAHVDVGTIREPHPTIYANPPLARPHVGLSLVLGPTNRLSRTEHCELGLPNQATRVSPGAPCSVDLVVERLAFARGGDARLKIHGVIDAYEFDMNVTTFVRDVIRPAALTPKP
jgi:hypothetical protein